MARLSAIAGHGLLVSLTIFVALLAADRLFPQMFSTHIAWWLLPILVAVHLIPRLIFLGIGAVLPRSGGRRT